MNVREAFPHPQLPNSSKPPGRDRAEMEVQLLAQSNVDALWQFDFLGGGLFFPRSLEVFPLPHNSSQLERAPDQMAPVTKGHWHELPQLLKGRTVVSAGCRYDFRAGQ